MGIIKNIQTYIKSLSVEQFLYLIALISSLLYFFRTWLLFPWYWATTSFLLVGFVFWMAELADEINSSIIGKSISATIAIVAITFNLALSSTGVNEVLQVPSSPFGYSITLMSVLSIPYTLSLVFSFTFPLLFMLAIVTSNLIKPNVDELYGRMISVAIVLTLAVTFLDDNKLYAERSAKVIKSFAYNFEMEKYSYCRLAKNERVAYLGGDKIVVGRKSYDSYVFIVEECKGEGTFIPKGELDH